MYVRPESWHGDKTPEAQLGDCVLDSPNLGHRILHNHCWRDVSCRFMHHLMDCFCFDGTGSVSLAGLSTSSEGTLINSLLMHR